MCIVSMVMDQFEKIIPHPDIPQFPPTFPHPIPQQPPMPCRKGQGLCFCQNCMVERMMTPGWPWSPVPSTGLPISPIDLKTLLDAFHKAVEAAKAADKASGQPDCVDPEKAKLEARVAELEKRLASLEQTSLHLADPVAT